MAYETWLKANAPSWLQDVYGAAWLGGIGAAMDDYVAQYVAGILAAFPDYAPADALGVLGDEIGLDRGPSLTDAQYAQLLAAAWFYWPLAGTPVGLLVALHFAGFDNAISVIQDGLSYQLTLPLVIGVSPIPNLVQSNLDVLATALTSSVTPARSIPAGMPWWTFDSNTDFCSRFALLWYGAPPSSFVTHARATFTGAEDGGAVPWPTLTWNNVFPSAVYMIQAGPPVVTSGPTGVPVVSYDPTTQTAAGVQVTSSGQFVGYVDFVASQTGANPYADPHPNDLARLRAVIAKWRPAKATCVGIYVGTQGKFFGWPVRLFSSGGTVGASTVVAFAP